MTKPYSSHHFIANYFIAGNIKGEWRNLFPAEPQFITTCSYPTIKTSATLMYSNRKPMGIKGIAKVAMGWFWGCDLSLDCRLGGEDNEQCRDTVHRVSP
nr:hypothetical protein [Tanacetum cinerariifolium]